MQLSALASTAWLLSTRRLQQEPVQFLKSMPFRYKNAEKNHKLAFNSSSLQISLLLGSVLTKGVDG